MADRLKKTVLVVDDEPDVRTFFETALTDAGFDVVTASNGEEALEKVKELVPDLISLDLVMPKKSGVRFYHELRRQQEWRKIPVIVVTAHANDEMGSSDLDQILNESTISGPGIYLEKPVTASSYVRSIKKTLGIKVEEKEDDPVLLKEQLSEQLRNTDPETLKKMLDMLKEE